METDDWLHVYAERDNTKEFIELCDAYQKGLFKWSHHPKDISLRFFVTYFKKNWTIKNQKTFPVFTPTYHFSIKKKSKSYQNWCWYTLLSEKPGFYITNVQTNFESCEEELRHFVLNSEHCPNLIKEKFEKIQLEDGEEKLADDASDDEDVLMMSPLDNSEEEDIIPTQFQINQINEDYDHAHEKDDEDTGEYDSEEFRANVSNHDWGCSDREILLNHMSEQHLNSATNFIENEKIHHSLIVTTENINVTDLRPAQQQFYDYITNWINQKLKDSNVPPIYVVLSGRAGCGKSFAVKCVNKFINENKKCLTGFLKIAAPTGTAAFLIKGTTLHSAFKLPVNVRFNDDIPPLQGSNLHQLQEFFKNTEIIMIDEMSMVGKYMLYQLSKRLQEIKPQNSTIEFAGVSIVLMGDFAQLPPVTDLPLFAGKEGTLNQRKGKALYQLFNKSFILSESMRHQGDDQQLFRNILDSIAKGTFNTAMWYTLQRNSTTMNAKGASDKFRDAVQLCARNKDSILFNIQKIKELNNPIAQIHAVNSTKKAKTFSANKAGGLQNCIIICKNSKVMLLSNLWKEVGLTNGANGFVKYIVYDEDKAPPKLPAFILVYFPQYTGPSFHPKEEKIVPIAPVFRKWFDSKVEHNRTMLPITPSYAITIHKSQGQTLDKIILNLGKQEFSSGLTYTAISRATKLENIAFVDPFPIQARIMDIFKSPRFKERLAEEERLRKLP